MSMLVEHPPSRFDNPFATCWTKPGALQFRFPPGQCAEQLLWRLAAHGWRGAIVGPHGSGKSTLLESLKPLIATARDKVLAIALRDRQRRLPRAFVESIKSLTPKQNGVMIIDGFEQLGWKDRLFLAYVSRRNGSGLLVTAHRPIRIPTLTKLAPNRALLSQLVVDLCAEVSTPVTSEDVAASHACHGSNVREIFFDLYDRHERKRRTLRTRRV
jgi:energy-coupling factor transporter ATP-binding protein EcfA2